MSEQDQQDPPKMRLARVRSDLIDRGVDVPLGKWRSNDGVLNVADRSDEATDVVEDVLAEHGFSIAGRALRKPRNGDPFIRFTVVEPQGDGDD